MSITQKAPTKQQSNEPKNQTRAQPEEHQMENNQLESTSAVADGLSWIG